MALTASAARVAEEHSGYKSGMLVSSCAVLALAAHLRRVEPVTCGAWRQLMFQAKAKDSSTFDLVNQ